MWQGTFARLLNKRKQEKNPCCFLHGSAGLTSTFLQKKNQLSYFQDRNVVEVTFWLVKYFIYLSFDMWLTQPSHIALSPPPALCSNWPSRNVLQARKPVVTYIKWPMKDVPYWANDNHKTWPWKSLLGKNLPSRNTRLTSTAYRRLGPFYIIENPWKRDSINIKIKIK